VSIRGGRIVVHSLFGVENPLMDVIAHVDYPFLQRFGKQPGTMHLVDDAEVTALLAEVTGPRTLPGGSAANTARGIAWLCGEEGRQMRETVLGASTSGPLPDAPVFNGAIGRDARGDLFLSQIVQAGVRASLVRKDTPTGTSVILVTPDGERTMNTYLGACRDFTAADLDRERLEDSRLLYLTGYLWDTENQRLAAEAAVDCARGGGGARPARSPLPVAFDLADPFAVRRYGDRFREWIPGHVDILFGNRDELALLTRSSCDEDCVGDAGELAPLVVMKIGAGGCIVGWKGTVVHAPGERVVALDTTGAGDAFAAGFLFGWMAGAEPRECARLANSLAARVVCAEGCTY
jgi:sugar/nucleoside kinase (ribokinase family)